MKKLYRIFPVFFVCMLLCGSLATPVLGLSVSKKEGRYIMGTCLLYSDIADGEVVGIRFEKSTPWKKEYDGEKLRDQLKKEAAPNSVRSVKSVPAAGIEKLEVDSDFCGIVLEKSTTGRFEIDRVGMKDPSLFAVNVSVSGSALEVEIKVAPSTLIYINTTQGSLTNVVRIRVPENTLNQLEIEDESSFTRMQELSAHQVQAATVNGIIRVQDKALVSDYSLSCVNGDVLAVADTISGKLEMETVNGDVWAIADAVTSPLDLSCVNGDVWFRASAVKDADFSCVNGDVWADLDAVSGKVKTSCTNGDVHINFMKKPTNLRLNVSAWDLDDVDLPYGWTAPAMVFGKGTGTVVLSTGWGDSEVTVGEDLLDEMISKLRTVPASK